MTSTAQCPRHPPGQAGRISMWHPASTAAESITGSRSRNTLRRTGVALTLVLFCAVTGMGCAALRAAWRGKHYVIALCQVTDGRFTQERLFSTTSPEGVPVKCKIRPIFTSNDIAAAEKQMQAGRVVGLRLTLTPESRMRWMQVREELRNGAIAIMVDDCACLVVSPVTTATFAETGVVQLTGTFNPALVDQVVNYAETNYTLKKTKEWR